MKNPLEAFRTLTFVIFALIVILAVGCYLEGRM